MLKLVLFISHFLLLHSYWYSQSPAVTLKAQLAQLLSIQQFTLKPQLVQLLSNPQSPTVTLKPQLVHLLPISGSYPQTQQLFSNHGTNTLKTYHCYSQPQALLTLQP